MIKGISLYDGAGLKPKDTMPIYLATTPDNSTSKWRRSSPKRLVIFWDNFEILLEVFIPNTPRNHCITYTNIYIYIYIYIYI